MLRTILPRSTTVGSVRRSMAALAEATDCWQTANSIRVNFAIRDDEVVQNAVSMLSTYDIGCLVTTAPDGTISGVLSERDIVKKVALVDRDPAQVRIKEIITTAPNLVTATPSDSVHECLNKMIEYDIRHLPIVDNNKAVGVLSIMACVQALLDEQDNTIEMLNNLSIGKSGTFVVD